MSSRRRSSGEASRTPSPRRTLALTGTATLLALGLTSPLAGPLAAPALADTPAGARAVDRPSKADLDVLYVGAHPDDEASRLSMFGEWRERFGARTGVVTVTRGEGGGNAIGPEEGPALGLIREREEREAVGTLGVTDVYNLDKVDFYYSVSAPLHQEAWNERETLGRLVRVDARDPARGRHDDEPGPQPRQPRRPPGGRAAGDRGLRGRRRPGPLPPPDHPRGAAAVGGEEAADHRGAGHRRLRRSELPDQLHPGRPHRRHLRRLGRTRVAQRRDLGPARARGPARLRLPGLGGLPRRQLRPVDDRLRLRAPDRRPRAVRPRRPHLRRRGLLDDPRGRRAAERRAVSRWAPASTCPPTPSRSSPAAPPRSTSC